MEIKNKPIGFDFKTKGVRRQRFFKKVEIRL